VTGLVDISSNVIQGEPRVGTCHPGQLECEKLMELTASSHRPYFFWSSHESRD